nr:hypothetical protein [Tanacetum cinerariifolium]
MASQRPVNGRSTADQRPRSTVAIGGQWWRLTTVAGGGPSLTTAGPSLTTTGQWWLTGSHRPGYGPGLDWVWARLLKCRGGNKSKVRYSRNKPNVSRMNTTSRENTSKMDDMIDKLADQISTLVDIFAKKVITPTPVKVVEESYVTCGGPHAHYNCDATNKNKPRVYVAMGTYNQVAHQNRASNYMAPPGFSPV